MLLRLGRRASASPSWRNGAFRQRDSRPAGRSRGCGTKRAAEPAGAETRSAWPRPEKHWSSAPGAAPAVSGSALARDEMESSWALRLSENRQGCGRCNVTHIQKTLTAENFFSAQLDLMRRFALGMASNSLSSWRELPVISGPGGRVKGATLERSLESKLPKVCLSLLKE
jgi:hypothetical protein